MKRTILQAASGGMFIGASGAGLLYNGALNMPAIFTLCGIVGLICGAAVVALAYVSVK